MGHPFTTAIQAILYLMATKSWFCAPFPPLLLESREVMSFYIDAGRIVMSLLSHSMLSVVLQAFAPFSACLI